MCRKGQAFLIPSGPDLHLYFAITDEDDNDGMQILANVTSIDEQLPYDNTCVFGGGEHGFIKDPSYVAYGYAIERHKNMIASSVEKKIYKEKDEDGDADLVEKIRTGLKKSPFTKRAIKDAYDRCVRAEEKRKKK